MAVYYLNLLFSILTGEVEDLTSHFYHDAALLYQEIYIFLNIDFTLFILVFGTLFIDVSQMFEGHGIDRIGIMSNISSGIIVGLQMFEGHGINVVVVSSSNRSTLMG